MIDFCSTGVYCVSAHTYVLVSKPRVVHAVAMSFMEASKVPVYSHF